METHIALARQPSDRDLPESVFPRPGRVPHRPALRFESVRIDSKDDVRVARRAGLNVSLLEPERIEQLGYPLSFRPRLMIEQSLVPIVQSRFHVLPVSDPSAARDPGIEDLIVAMLTVDQLGARRIAREHRSEIDPVRLLKRVLAEDLERRAYEVRLDQFAPGIPRVAGVEPLSPAALRSEDVREFSWGPRT